MIPTGGVKHGELRTYGLGEIEDAAAAKDNLCIEQLQTELVQRRLVTSDSVYASAS